MAVIRRHLKLAILNALVIVTAIIALTVYLVRGGVRPSTVRAESAVNLNGPATTAPSPLDAQSLARINELRQQLYLTDGDLAAMSCTKDQATTILTNLKTWYQANSATWEADDSQIQGAQAALQETWRKINVGPKDDSLIGQLPNLQQAVSTAAQQRTQLFAAASSAVSSTLNLAQTSVWATAKANAAAPEQYRYVPNLTSDQIQQLVIAIYHNARTPQAMSGIEQNILTGDQRQAMSAIASAQAQSAVAVSAAGAAAFPLQGQ